MKPEELQPHQLTQRMTDEPIDADALFKNLVARSVTATLKAAGFRKTSTNYHRRLGETVQVVNVQRSNGCTQERKEFFINVGLAFDSCCTLMGLPILEKPLESNCDFRGTRDRLENLLPNVPASWEIKEDQAIGALNLQLQIAITHLIRELDTIDAPRTYRQHRWFERFRPVAANAQIMYLLGDDAGALREVQALAELFADRKSANQASWWLDYLHLDRLKPRTVE